MIFKVVLLGASLTVFMIGIALYAEARSRERYWCYRAQFYDSSLVCSQPWAWELTLRRVLP